MSITNDFCDEITTTEWSIEVSKQQRTRDIETVKWLIESHEQQRVESTETVKWLIESHEQRTRDTLERLISVGESPEGKKFASGMEGEINQARQIGLQSETLTTAF